MRLQIAWSLLPRLVRSCAIVDQRRVRGLALRASRGQIFIAITRRVIAISPGTPGAFFSRQIATIFSRHRGLACLLVSRGNFHQFSPVFTSSWAAVEVNAVQTKCELYWGAIADLSPKDGMTVEKVSLAVLAVLGVVGLAYFIATTLEVLPIISAS